MRTTSLPLLALLTACGGSTQPAPPPAAGARATAPSSALIAAAPAPKAVKRTVVVFGRPCGSSVTKTKPDGTISAVLDVLENGRGPHVEWTLRLAADGTPVAFDARGHHELGTPIDETFTRSKDGHAAWKSHEEKGDRDVSGAAFFLPISDSPEMLGYLAQALLAAGGKLPLLPGGEARIEPALDTTVRVGSAEKHLAGYAITGFDLTPTYVWMNDDRSWFGTTHPWFSVVPEGWEGVIDTLVAVQERYTRDRDARIAAKVARKPPAGGFAFVHARVLDVEKGAWLDDRTVLVQGDVIRAVGTAIKVPAGAEVIDLAGKAVVPGLWDMHAHIDDSTGVLDVASGVTTVRDLANDPDQLDDYKKRFDEGSAVGPRVLRFGFIEGRGELAASSKVTAETEAEAKAAVETYAKRGYDGIKIYNSVKPELVPLLAKEAHARGMIVTGHVPVHMLANEAVRAGYDGIEHINMLFLNFLADHDTDTRTTARFTILADKAATLDLKSKPVVDFIALLKAKGTVIDPTLGVMEDLVLGEPGKVLEDSRWIFDRLPVQTQRARLVVGLPSQPEKEALHKESWARALAMVKALHDAKVPLVAGTDALAGLSFHRELAAFVASGISTADTLRMATIEAARAMKRDKRSGSIAAGKEADLLVVDGDPLARIEDARNVVRVLRGGVMFSAPELYDTMGVMSRPESRSAR